MMREREFERKAMTAREGIMYITEEEIEDALDNAKKRKEEVFATNDIVAEKELE